MENDFDQPMFKGVQRPHFLVEIHNTPTPHTPPPPPNQLFFVANFLFVISALSSLLISYPSIFGLPNFSCSISVLTTHRLAYPC